MLRWALLVPLLLLLVPASLAQSQEELKFNEKQAKALHGYAASALKEGFPRVAKNVWLMILSEYDPDFADAREALGYQKLGDSWGLDPKFAFPKDDNPDPKAASKLQKKWESVAESVAKAHEAMAEKYAKAGRTDMSIRHYEKVLFFVPSDEDAQEALHHKDVAGLTGTDLEQVLYERSKKIERVVAEEARKDYPVEVLPDATHPFLENAKLKYKSVKSEHYTVRGDFDVELLMEAARNAERGLRVMQAITEGYEGFATDPRQWITDQAFFQDGDTYKQVLNANAHLMDAQSLKFRIEQTRGSALQDQSTILAISAPQNEQGVYDGAVRNVAQFYSNLRTPGLREGIGHAVVGMLFNNNRQFIVDREEQLRSSVGEEDIDKYNPNMDTWKDLALEAAWKLGEGTPAAQLPLIDAAKFPDDARIKAWSFCDYVLRRDPTLLLDLDQLAGEQHPIEVEKKFTETHEVSIAQLEKEWKDFWTEASPVLKAIRSNTEPLSAVSKDVKKWLEAFNKARGELGVTDVTWSASYSGRCREHAEYLLAHEEERGPDREQGQDIALDGGTHLGDMFAQMALVCTDAKKPKDVFKLWLEYPGYRDALINNRLRTVGLYVDGDVLVMDGIRGVGRPPEGKGGYTVYPSSPRIPIPNQVDVADLGPELEALLAKSGHGDKTVIGCPLTLHHFGNGGVPGNRESYRCTVTLLGEPVEGILHVADGGANRRTSAPGMVVFYPLEPLKKGNEFEMVWTFETATGTSRTVVKFNT